MARSPVGGSVPLPRRKPFRPRPDRVEALQTLSLPLAGGHLSPRGVLPPPPGGGWSYPQGLTHVGDSPHPRRVGGAGNPAWGEGLVHRLIHRHTTAVWWSILAPFLGVLGGTVAGGVVAAWLLRKRTQDPDVDELVAAVAQLQRTTRRIEMQRVRSFAPPVVPAATPRPMADFLSKAALRSRVFGATNPDYTGVSSVGDAGGEGTQPVPVGGSEHNALLHRKPRPA